MDFKPAEPSTRFRDFSDLYRAALAERDPDLKGRLLREVQKAIDANPKVFKAFATQLAGSMDELVAATKTKNAQKLFDVSGRLDQECEGCHMQFWYPDEKK